LCGSFFFFQAEDGIRDFHVTGVQTCDLPIFVEHDEDTIRSADWMVDIGPAAGEHGGEIIASGPVDEVIRHPSSLTARYLRGDLEIPTPPSRRRGTGKRLVVRGAAANNLKGIDV